MSLILDGTNGLSDVDGSAATPAIRGSDANTGVFFGTDVVGLSTGGSERVRVDAAGNVGIGTDSPAPGNFGLHINKASEDFVALRITNSATGSTSGDGLAIQVTSTGLARIRQFENLGLTFETNNTERARIDSSGNLLVGTTAQFGDGISTDIRGSGSNTTSTIFFNRANTAASGFVFVFRNAGTNVGTVAHTNTTTTYATSSDYRLKHDIQPMTGALAKVAQLKPVTYKWNADDSESQGFIAHELQEVVPECVTGEKDAVDAEGNPQYQGIDTSFLVATLTAAIQELKGINDAQAQIITALTARVEALEGAQA
jgi:hypothetical protein